MRKNLIKAHIIIPLGWYELIQDQALLKRNKQKKKTKKWRKIKHTSKRECQKQVLVSETLESRRASRYQQRDSWNEPEVHRGKDWLRLRRGKNKGGSLALAAGELAASLAVCGWGKAYVHYVVAWRLIMSGSVRYLLLRDDTVDFCKRNHNNVKVRSWFPSSWINSLAFLVFYL